MPTVAQNRRKINKVQAPPPMIPPYKSTASSSGAGGRLTSVLREQLALYSYCLSAEQLNNEYLFIFSGYFEEFVVPPEADTYARAMEQLKTTYSNTLELVTTAVSESFAIQLPTSPWRVTKQYQGYEATLVIGSRVPIREGLDRIVRTPPLPGHPRYIPNN